MTAEFESIVELLLVILTIACILQVIFTGMLLRYMKRVAESLGRAGAPVLPPPAPGPVAARAPKATAAEPGSSAPAPPATAVTVAPAVDLLTGSPDIHGSILRLCDKYDLADFILATHDGLLVVSFSPGSSEEAARFSDLYRRKKKPDTPGVTFLEINHRGEPMLGIVRSDRPLPPDRLSGIGEDARKILNWWL